MDKLMQNTYSSSDDGWITAALQAVKLDPAVLDAEITVDRRNMNQQAWLEGEQQVAKKAIHDNGVSPKPSKFEDMMEMVNAALFSLSPYQFDLLLKYAEILRMQRVHNQKHLECAFCKNNGEPASWYTLHMLKDIRGRVRCPVLRGYRCPVCGATGDFAHTIKYCPLMDRDRWSC